LITATHTHSVPFVFPQPKPDPEADRLRQAYADKVFQSVKMAKEELQPAAISFGTGVSYINVQRDIIDRTTHRWWEGANYDGLSDKTVAVIRLESLNHDLIAIYYNYGMHAVITGTLDLVSGDVPGATSRYIESHFNDKTVALWSEGAAGDQNPVYFQQTYDLRTIRTKDYAQKGQDISNSMPPGGVGLDRNNPEVQHLMEEQKAMITSMGQCWERKFCAWLERRNVLTRTAVFSASSRPSPVPDVSAPTKAVAGPQEPIRRGRMSTSRLDC
jgi:hypothetical protein